MVSEYQNSNSEDKFLKNLLPLAKQLDSLRRTREFKIEFENEKSNFPFKHPGYQNQFSKENEKSEPGEQNEDLKMQVYDDKDYDIEEIKFWNFVSKNKGIKPNVIRTIVYKVPESSYIIRKVPVIVEELEENPTEKNESKSVEIKKDIQTNKKSESKIFNQLNLKSTPNNQPKLITSSRKESNQPKFTQPMKFDSEDIILIDEDDDIIGFEDENEEEKYSINRSNENSKDMHVDEDDDIIEENYIEKNDLNNFNESKQETIEGGDNISLLHKSFNIQKKPRRGRPVGRPKVVVDKVDEPVSTISIKKSSDFEIKSAASNTNKSLPVISQVRSINTRKSLTMSKKQDSSETLEQVSPSSSNISTV